MSRKMKPLQLFAPISRVDAKERIVEGHAFVNEVVEGEGGIRLLRSTMEAATPDYMRWGAVREMHQPSAVGTALDVQWDETGAFFRCKVVDDAAWAKVEAGVYKGFSVGVLPRVMRGNNVTVACWAETSLVDRPKDPDTAFSVFRAEGFDPTAEVEVEDLEPAADPLTDPPAAEIERGYVPDTFSVTIAEREEAERRSAAWDTLMLCLWSIQAADPATVPNREELARTSIQEFADYYVPLLVTGETGERVTLPSVTRVATLEAENERGQALNAALIERAAFAERQVAEEHRALVESEELLIACDRDLRGAQERIQALERAPITRSQPVRFPAAAGLERSFLANQGEGKAEEMAEKQSELQRLLEEVPKEPDAAKRLEGAARVNLLRMQLAGQA